MSHTFDHHATWPSAITAAMLDKVLLFLAPLFLGAVALDIVAARRAAAQTLAGYGAQSDQELRLVALTIAFSLGALDMLGRSADPALSTNQVLRLRGNASSLNRAVQQSETRRDKLTRGGGALAPDDAAEPDVLPASTEVADLLAFNRPSSLGIAPKPIASVGRQERRASERKAEKLRVRQLEIARLAKRASVRSAARERKMAWTHDTAAVREAMAAAGPPPGLHGPVAAQ